MSATDLPAGTGVLYAHIAASLDGDPPAYLTAWQDALTFAVAHPLEAVALLEEMDVHVAEFTDDDRLEQPARAFLFSDLVRAMAQAVSGAGR